MIRPKPKERHPLGGYCTRLEGLCSSRRMSSKAAADIAARSHAFGAMADTDNPAVLIAELRSTRANILINSPEHFHRRFCPTKKIKKLKNGT